MGIPKFFRWMSERYPGLLETAKENQLPDIDNFYLDMNGIIHNCSHPNDGDVHFRISEKQIFEDIFNYVNTLFRIIKPRQYFFMAVDGVAPRAKMNQQRGRRFRTAKEASDREEAALKRGQILPDEQRFDSNCITPGTTFMVKLHKALQQFIRMKLSTDPSWQKVKVILSGHETPGEGEHKIMDFIRHQRSLSNYSPDTRHCLYGLDTDLIMLGLSLHEPNFTLLREEMKFGNKKNDATRGKSQRVDPSKISFNVLYLGLLRDYIEKDFLPLKPKMNFKFDLEAIIDDWILICFLVGNDFIPHIPHFHIHKNALPKIFDVYQATLPSLNGYMNEKGVLNLPRFKTFAKALAVVDLENYKTLVKENGGECAKDDFSKLNMFVRQKMRITGIRDSASSHHRKSYTPRKNPSHHSHNHQSETWYNIQQRRSLHSTPKTGVNHRPQNTSTNGRVGVHSFTEEQINNSITVCADGDFIDSSDDEDDDFVAYRRTYYREKLKLKPDKRSILGVVHEYVRALQWNLHYYYHGCLSWGWFYPYHYAPFISDIANFTNVNMEFKMGIPFKPFDQLLSVLPAASSSLLPKMYQSLVTSSSSPLAKYFPVEVEYDLNGKQNDWEAVVLAPFIDEDVLLKASVCCNLFLTNEERENNAHGPHLLFQYFGPSRGVKQQQGKMTSSSGSVNCTPIDLDGFFVPLDDIKYGLLQKEVPKNPAKKLTAPPNGNNYKNKNVINHPHNNGTTTASNNGITNRKIMHQGAGNGKKYNTHDNQNTGYSYRNQANNHNNSRGNQNNNQANKNSSYSSNNHNQNDSQNNSHHNNHGHNNSSQNIHSNNNTNSNSGKNGKQAYKSHTKIDGFNKEAKRH